MSTSTIETVQELDFSCPHCGRELKDFAATAVAAPPPPPHQVDNFKQQGQVLATGATDADPWTELEVHVRPFHAESKSPDLLPSTTSGPEESTQSSGEANGLGFLSFLRPPRIMKEPPKLSTSTSASINPAIDLMHAFSRERRLRQVAEGKLAQVNGELEELSSQLFTQANQMVATERKAREKLEFRVKILEKRESEKKQRLEILERSIQRIERVRGLLISGRKIP